MLENYFSYPDVLKFFNPSRIENILSLLLDLWHNEIEIKVNETQNETLYSLVRLYGIIGRVAHLKNNLDDSFSSNYTF